MWKQNITAQNVLFPKQWLRHEVCLMHLPGYVYLLDCPCARAHRHTRTHSHLRECAATTRVMVCLYTVTVLKEGQVAVTAFWHAPLSPSGGPTKVSFRIPPRPPRSSPLNLFSALQWVTWELRFSAPSEWLQYMVVFALIGSLYILQNIAMEISSPTCII